MRFTSFNGKTCKSQFLDIFIFYFAKLCNGNAVFSPSFSSYGAHECPNHTISWPCSFPVVVVCLCLHNILISSDRLWPNGQLNTGRWVLGHPSPVTVWCCELLAETGTNGSTHWSDRAQRTLPLPGIVFGSMKCGGGALSHCNMSSLAANE